MTTETSLSGTASSSTSAKLQDKVDSAAQTAHDTIDRLASQAGPAIDQLDSMATQAAQSMQAKAEAFGAMQEEWMENARDYVREHPLRAVAAALVAGVLISRLAR